MRQVIDIVSLRLGGAMINRLFTSHPESVGETYLEHMSSASTFGLHLMLAGLACTVHAILPFLFKTTGRSAITDLHEKMVTHRHRSDRIGAAGERVPSQTQ